MTLMYIRFGTMIVNVENEPGYSHPFNQPRIWIWLGDTWKYRCIWVCCKYAQMFVDDYTVDGDGIATFEDSGK